MSSTDAVSETLDETGSGTVDRATSLFESLAPKLARHAESGNLAAASGAVSLVRAGRTFLKGNRKRGVAQALVGLFWVGVALAQRRSDGPGPHSGDELSEVVDTSPDVEGAVEPGGRETDHATGEEVVDTTDADVEETDTAPEEGVSPEVESEVENGDTDQRDVVETAEVEDAAETGEDGEAGASSEGESGDAENRTEGESAE